MTRRKLLAPHRPALVDSQATLVVAPVGSVGSTAFAVAEVLELPIRLLRSMPLPSSLVCSFAREDGRVVLATVSPPSPWPGDPPTPVFAGPEVDALALAAEHGRAYEATLRAWCAKRAQMADWRLTTAEVLGHIGFRPEPLGWTTARVLAALGLRLEEVLCPSP